MRIDSDYGHSSSKQFMHPLPNEGLAMAIADHFGNADILIYTARATWQMREMMLIPSVNRIVLHICEGLPIQLDNPS